MVIIIEGPDGSGKTTLAEKLSRQTKYPIIHRSQPKTDEEKKLMMGEYLQTIRSGKNMIFAEVNSTICHQWICVY